MFTGIVDHVGKIEKITANPTGTRLEISTRFETPILGESISVDGACLTVTEATNTSGAPGFACELSPETLALTIARQYRLGSVVNLERALRMGDALGGHWVTGHVEQVGLVVEKEVLKDFWRLKVGNLKPELSKALVPKGSITVNGVSLTVNAKSEDSFEVMLIPHTLERTNLRELEVGSQVNLEMDWMAKLVVQEVQRLFEGHVCSSQVKTMA